MIAVRKFIKTHIDWVLLAAALVVVAVLAWFLVWGITTLAQSLGSSLSNPPAAGSGGQFDLNGASKLNLHGLQAQ